jgi:hypothetical protein
MITDLDESIKKLLMAEIPIKNGEIDIKFDQPKREWSAKLNKPTINFYLYDLRENVILRQHQWEQLGRNGNGNLNIAHLKRTPFRVDCHYMITTWVPQERADDEHRLLSLCLLALFRNPILPEEYMVGQMQHQPFEVNTRLASHDKLTNPAEVWSALDNEMRPSVSFLVTIAMDPWSEHTEEIVRSFNFRLGPTGEGSLQSLDGVASEKAYIGGHVTLKGEPQTGIRVAVKGTGYVDETDGDGRFRLGSLSYGDYTLIAWPEKGKPKELNVTIPGGSCDIEL